ncbi:hypothetical protein J2Y41_004662 [Arthrobacter sp. 1088]|uniref:hypothetical protein n=1 Tax=Arthrobacter sp. 1088 TaxID=2817768 RepID=UPI00285F3544|nr:hypothetical protein [Arthrobacter sp. 1088]MDR6689058.1 hypothetical protein [Arthrobacter sp. 1088]
MVSELLVAVAVAVYAWIGVYTQNWHGNTLESIGQKVQEASAGHVPPQGFGREVFDILGQAVELVKADPPYGFSLVIVLLGAVVVSGSLLVRSWFSLFDWCAYIGFFRGTASRGLKQRAERFDRRGWKEWLRNLFFALIGAGFASGLVFKFLEAASGMS